MDASIIADIRKAEAESEDILKQAELEKSKILQQAQDAIAKQKEAKEQSRKEKEDAAFAEAVKGFEQKEKAILAQAEKQSLQLREKAAKQMGKAVAYIDKEFMNMVK